jgi:hypothetical protein
MGREIRAELAAKVAAIGMRVERATRGELASDLESIRRIAAAHGMTPAVTVVHALDSALSRGERGPLLRGWLAILSDAVNCERHDGQAVATFAAACTVRQAR